MAKPKCKIIKKKKEEITITYVSDKTILFNITEYADSINKNYKILNKYIGAYLNQKVLYSENTQEFYLCGLVDKIEIKNSILSFESGISKCCKCSSFDTKLKRCIKPRMVYLICFNCGYKKEIDDTFNKEFINKKILLPDVVKGYIPIFKKTKIKNHKPKKIKVIPCDTSSIPIQYSDKILVNEGLKNKKERINIITNQIKEKDSHYHVKDIFLEAKRLMVENEIPGNFIHNEKSIYYVLKNFKFYSIFTKNNEISQLLILNKLTYVTNKSVIHNIKYILFKFYIKELVNKSVFLTWANSLPMFSNNNEFIKEVNEFIEWLYNEFLKSSNNKKKNEIII